MKGFNEKTAMILGVLEEIDELYDLGSNFLCDLFVSKIDKYGNQIGKNNPMQNDAIIDSAEGTSRFRKALERFMFNHLNFFIDFRGYYFVNVARCKILLKKMVGSEAKIITFSQFIRLLGDFCVYNLYYKSGWWICDSIKHAEGVLRNYLSIHKDFYILTGENCEINIEVDIPLYTYKSFINLKCLKNKHDIRNESLYYMSSSGKVIVVPTHFCRTCGKYFIAQRVLSFYDKNVGTLICKRINATPNEFYDYYSRLNEQSELHSYGYNVVEGRLSEKQRRYMLIYLVENHIMKTEDICRDILNAISLSEMREDRENAIDKWNADLKFIEEYGMIFPMRNQMAYLKR